MKLGSVTMNTSRKWEMWELIEGSDCKVRKSAFYTTSQCIDQNMLTDRKIQLRQTMDGSTARSPWKKQVSLQLEAQTVQWGWESGPTHSTLSVTEPLTRHKPCPWRRTPDELSCPALLRAGTSSQGRKLPTKQPQRQVNLLNLTKKGHHSSVKNK